jgi:hypothetical protein
MLQIETYFRVWKIFSTVCLGSAMLCFRSIITMTEEEASQNNSKSFECISEYRNSFVGDCGQRERLYSDKLFVGCFFLHKWTWSKK